MNAHVTPPKAGSGIGLLIAMAIGNVNRDEKNVSVATPGRPRGASAGSERSRQPWIAEGISQRTFYRRKAAVAAALPEPPQQHGAHVAAWYATLGPIARLEHRAFVRRCLLAIARGYTTRSFPNA